MANAQRDQNSVPTLLGVSNADGSTPIAIYADPTTHRLLVDLPGGTGTVTSVSVVTANGFAGSVATATTTPAITLSTTITGILKGNGTAISAATAGTDYVTASSTNTFTNKTYDTAGAGNSFSINSTAITAVTGTGAVVLANTPTLITPVIGVATGTSLDVSGVLETGTNGGYAGGATGGNGGSGIVVISFPEDGSTGVSTSSTGGTITSSGGNQIHTFTSDGTWTMVAYVPSNGNFFMFM